MAATVRPTEQLLDLAAVAPSNRLADELAIGVEDVRALAIRVHIHHRSHVVDLKCLAIDDQLDRHVVDHDRFPVGQAESFGLRVDQSADDPHRAVTFVEGFGFVAALVDRDRSAHKGEANSGQRFGLR